MEVLLIFAALFVGLGSGVTLAVRTMQRKQIDYKQRWKEALKLLETERLKTGSLAELEEGDSARAETNEALLKRLLEMSDYDRYVMEGKRLKAKLEPIDPLTDMNDYDLSRMIDRRLRYGYDSFAVTEDDSE